MPARTHPRLRLVSLFLMAGGLFALATACNITSRGQKRQIPLPPGADPGQLSDKDAPEESKDPLDPDALARVGKDIQEKQQKDRERREKLGVKLEDRKKYNFLAISGGGVYGAYPAGVLCGWSASGKTPEEGGRPVFDVVTGISTGSIIAPFAFLGSEFDPQLRSEYTTVTNDDVYVRRRSLRSLFAESFVDTTPLRNRIARFMTPENMVKLSEAHRDGRRLYIGTTNLDTKRLIVWDIGAIATRGGPEARCLIIDIIMASSAIPGFFPSVRFNVDIDGQRFEELHVDGGVTRGLFFRPPPKLADPSKDETLDPSVLASSTLYCLVAGKLFADPDAVRPRSLQIALQSISNLLYADTRAELYRLYTYCILTGMNFRESAIPQDFPLGKSATSFDPVETTKMFCEGYKSGKEGAFRVAPKKDLKGNEIKDAKGNPDTIKTLDGTAWRDTPPGLEPGEELRARTGLRQTVLPRPKDPDAQTPPPFADTPQTPKPREVKPDPKPESTPGKP